MTFAKEGYLWESAIRISPIRGLSPEGGTRICYTGMSDGDIPDEPLCSETERAFALLKELADLFETQTPGVHEPDES